MNPNRLRREIDLLKREKELAERELEIVRRELRGARGENGIINREPEKKVNLNEIKELVTCFEGTEGTFEGWKKQIKYVMNTYDLNEDKTKILLSTRLKRESFGMVSFKI